MPASKEDFQGTVLETVQFFVQVIGQHRVIDHVQVVGHWSNDGFIDQYQLIIGEAISLQVEEDPEPLPYLLTDGEDVWSHRRTISKGCLLYTSPSPRD